MLRRGFCSIVLAATALLGAEPRVRVKGVEAIGVTVSDLDRALDFYTKVLAFEKVSEWERAGAEWEHLQGLFGVRMRTARLRVGEEHIELTEYLAPQGRPIPVDSRSNDGGFSI